MKSNETTTEVEAETLRLIKRESDEYFHKFFASHKDSIKTVSEVEKLTGDFLDKRLKDVSAKESVSFADDVTLKVAVGGAVYPVLHVVVAEWKSGGLFKKATKGLFFIWNSDVKSSDVAMPLSDFYGFLDTNGLSNLSASVNYAGAAVSNIKVADVQQKLANEEPLFFSNSDEWQACDVNYSLKSISYDKENKALVLKVEDRLFT